MLTISKQTVLKLVEKLTILTSLFILLYIFLIHLYLLIDPSHRFLDSKAYDISYLRQLFFLVILLSTVNLSLFVALRKSKLAVPFNFSTTNNILALLTGFFLALFFKSIFIFLEFFQYPFFILEIGFFYFFILQVNRLFLNFRFSNLQFINEAKTSLNLNKVFLNVLTVISLSLSIVSLYLVTDIFIISFKEKTQTKNPYRESLYIREVIPQMALHATRVRIIGYNFGWKPNLDKHYRVMTDYGPIRLVEEWTNEHIDFTVPLGTRVGKRQLWVERPEQDSKKDIKKKSNVVTFEVFSRFIFYPDIDDTKSEKIMKIVKRILFFNIKIFNNLLFRHYE